MSESCPYCETRLLIEEECSGGWVLCSGCQRNLPLPGSLKAMRERFAEIRSFIQEDCASMVLEDIKQKRVGTNWKRLGLWSLAFVVVFGVFLPIWRLAGLNKTQEAELLMWREHCLDQQRHIFHLEDEAASWRLKQQ